MGGVQIDFQLELDALDEDDALWQQQCRQTNKCNHQHTFHWRRYLRDENPNALSLLNVPVDRASGGAMTRDGTNTRSQI